MLYKRSIYQLLIVLLLYNSASFSQNIILQNGIIKNGNIYYLSNIIHVKLKHEVNAFQKSVEVSSSIKKRLEPYNLKNVYRTFSSGDKLLSRIVTVEYNSKEDPLIVASKLNGLEDVQWAEPHYIYKTSFVPSDPQFSDQWNLQNIQASDAWDISHGDTSIVIGIIDTGVEWVHPDLSENIWINSKEIPGNSVDDDHNGYIDDVRGWDFGGSTGTSDNDPNEDQPAHGTHVAGIASAVTNNDEGIASIGYNCKIMPVKVSIGNYRDENGEPFIVYGIEGIKYAAENGAKIINCSFGSGAFSMLGQEVVNYAVSKGSLIVAAAGNEHTDLENYPSGYNGVLSVASIGTHDVKSYFSNYGFSVDVSAPGEQINSTWKGSTYNVISGTSMASPLVAGLAGLVASKFPNYTPLQIGEQIRVNTDNINNFNPGIANKIGGRINAFKALNNTNSKSVRATQVAFTENNPSGSNNGFFERGDIINVSVKFFNFLNPINNLTITLESQDHYAAVINPTLNVSSAASLDSFNNSSNQFQFMINQNSPNDVKLTFLIKYNSDGYSDYQWISVMANPTYRTQSSGQIILTVTSKGALGFNDYPVNHSGQGFRFRGGSNLLFEGALMFGNSPTHVSDAARIGGNNGQSTDFTTISPVVIRSIMGNQEGFTSFSDSGAPPLNRLNILTEQYSYSYVSPSNNDFIILRYKMINNSRDQITNFFAGLFMDWDIIEGSGQGDVVNYNPDSNFGYAFHDTAGPSTIVGCALLSHGKFNIRGILNTGADNSGIEIYNDFTEEEKWAALSSQMSYVKAGPGDISMVASGGPYNINAGDTLDIAFSLAAGSNFEELQQAIQASRVKYHEIDTTTVITVLPVEFKLFNNYPNPFNSMTTIVYQLPHRTHVQLKVYDILGNEITTLVNREQEPDRYVVRYNASGNGLSSGIYFYRIITDDFTEVKKMMYLK